ncbi:SCAN domain-containing protein 3-like [Aphis gossypii]|uniref:SCAN domain-containing protein 3-like n=1 Tax=Aphis gossypii TaxID=80765 RepID=UPI00215923EB|nr:SCAN domain-containing protein 3-like [Aphis gossypii]
MTNLNVTDITSSIALSNNTVSRRIDEMAYDVEIKLCDILRNTKFSLQLDESTLRDNEALLLAYVRYVNIDEKITEELLFAKSLITDTKGLTIFNVVNNFFIEKGIPITNCIACATDGAPAMIGRQRGFIAHLKNAVPGILTVHCVIHRQHLIAKNLSNELFDTMRFVINAVNKIKAKSLNDRLFRQLCHENDEDFERLILHTEVRWLSKGNYSDLEIYCAHLESLKDDMSTRFKDINDLIIPEWVLNPFLADIQNVQPLIQEELLEVKHNEEAKIDFKHKGYELFWLKQKTMYPQIWKEVELLIMAFPSTYLVEKGFSAVQQLLTKSRNKLEICERGDLRLMLTSIEPDIISLAGKHQPQGSH